MSHWMGAGAAVCIGCLCVVAAGRSALAGAATARPAGVAARIALVSDPHVSPDPRYAHHVQNFRRTIAEVNAAGVDAVLVAGDLVEHGNRASFEQYRAMAAAFAARSWAIAGNHDVGNKRMPDKPATTTDPRVAQFEELIGPSFYAAEVVPGVRLVAVNSAILDAGLDRERDQWAFLERELNRPRDGVTLFLTHYPPFASTPDESDEYFNINAAARAKLLPLLKRGGVNAILSGHLHRPIDTAWEGIPIVGAPPVSFGLPRGEQRVGWTLLTVDAGGKVTAELRYLADPAEPPTTFATTAPATAPANAPAARTDALRALGPIAVLPMADPDNHVLEYLRQRGAGERIQMLGGEEVLDPAKFSPDRFKVCLYLGGEQYLRTVREAGDVDRAIRRYASEGGVLVVLPTGPYPFYMDERGDEVLAGSQLGLVFLGNGEQEGTAFGFDQLPNDPGLSFLANRDAFALQGVADRLPLPDSDDVRWRPLVRTALNAGYEPWITLRDGAGRSLGDAAAWSEKAAAGAAGPVRAAFASYLLTQRHPQRDDVLDAVFVNVARKVTGIPATAPAAPAQVPDVSDRVHIFYYNWYGAPPHQPGFVHWQQGGRKPPDDIGANFYPLLAAYSSSDPEVLERHMGWIRQARVGVLVLTWWGRESYEDRHAEAVLDAAAKAGLKVAFHLEPYEGFAPDKLPADVAYLLDRYGRHPASYRAASLGGRPVVYVFEALKHPASAWRPALDRVHGAAEPVAVIAQTSDLTFVGSAGFDGGYTYDGLAPFKHPDYLRNWAETAARFAEAGKTFIPSVGPGYWDDRAVPNGADEPEAARTRDGGAGSTYDAAWRAATDAGAPFVSITSFNEWHEGSQIEPAVARDVGGYRYPPYAGGRFEYLERTAAAVERFVKRRAADASAAPQ